MFCTVAEVSVIVVEVSPGKLKCVPWCTQNIYMPCIRAVRDADPGVV